MVDEFDQLSKVYDLKDDSKMKQLALSSGSTLLNLACSDHPDRGFLTGKYYMLVGDAATGKTFLAITCLAEACMSKAFQKYRLIYDNVEDGCLLNLEKLFNRKVRDGIEPPSSVEGGLPAYSSTVEEFYFHVDDAIKKKKPFIYVLDSMDALTDEAEQNKFAETKKARRANKQVSGSYQMDKAKKNSTMMRQILPQIRKSGSILIVLIQTRDNVGFGFEKKTRGGGHALEFYSTAAIWMSKKGVIRKTIQGKRRAIGVSTKVKIKRNRVTGSLSEFDMDIYPSYGIDDVGGCIDYLISEGWWKKSGRTIRIPKWNFKGDRAKLIALIESKNAEHKLRKAAGKCWNNIKKDSALKRKGRYELDTD